jgi:hypothetical protein
MQHHVVLHYSTVSTTEDDMTDNVAVMQDYTIEVTGDNGQGQELYLLVKPNTDLDSSFKAWDTDEQEFVQVNGWLWTFTSNASGQD